jgi:hypothetical protein
MTAANEVLTLAGVLCCAVLCCSMRLESGIQYAEMVAAEVQVRCSRRHRTVQQRPLKL